MIRLGIDIGGSGVKGAPVDTEAGEFAEERVRIDTPRPASAEAVTEVVTEVARHHGTTGPIGVTFPGVVEHGVIRTAANLDDSWIDVDADHRFEEATGRPVHVLNDADAAGLAEVRFGAGRGVGGVVIVLTFGTGIGSAVFLDGALVPNTEFGHLELDGAVAEHRASAAVRKDEGLSWSKWAARVDRYLHHLERIFTPDLFIVGGGVSRKQEKWVPDLTVTTDLVPAELRNQAGIVGAALATL